MLVDDEPDSVRVVTAMLERKGYFVHGFTEPITALAHVKDCKECSIVISDIKMPGMNGMQLIRLIKQERPEIKVILMSAFEINQSEWQQVMPSTVVNQFLKKSFTGSQLEKAIENCVPLVY